MKKTRQQLSVRRGAPPPATVAKFLEASKATQWPKGTSGNPAGANVEFRDFVNRCRQATPEVIKELLAAVRLPRRKEFWRYKIYAADLLLSRAWGKAPQVVIDAPTGDKQPPRPALTAAYWSDFIRALRESGALDEAVEVDAGDAEVVVEPTKLLDAPDAEPPP